MNQNETPTAADRLKWINERYAHASECYALAGQDIAHARREIAVITQAIDSRKRLGLDVSWLDEELTRANLLLSQAHDRYHKAYTDMRWYDMAEGFTSQEITSTENR